MSESLECRRAQPEDSDQVTTLIALAFAADPLWSWAMTRPDGQPSDQRRLWRVFVDGALRYRWTWLTAGGEAVSIWIPPGGTEMSEEQEEHLSVVAAEVLGPAADRYLELFERFSDAHPSEPHYYLSLLGTHPEHRGRGIGMALLAHDLDLIDAEGMPAYLESSNPANNKRYASVGFEAVGKFSGPGDGPVVTTMWRAAR